MPKSNETGNGQSFPMVQLSHVYKVYEEYSSDLKRNINYKRLQDPKSLKKTALRDVTCTIKRGERVAFLGKTVPENPLC